jgi:hypothetical protein
MIFKGILKPGKSIETSSTSLIFTGNQMLAEKTQASPFLLNEGQPIAFSNEGTVRQEFSTFLISLGLWLGQKNSLRIRKYFET